jgi:hypothetical protein
MDAGLILQGAVPDLLGVMTRSNEAAQQRIGFDRQNALADLYQQQGPGIAAGDPNAVNALAQFDPMAAMGVQGARLDMQATQQRMDMLTREEERQVAQAAQSMSAAERAEQAASIEDGVKMGLAARSPQEWDQMMSQLAPELVGQFEQRQMLANRYMSIADIMKRQDESLVVPDPTKGAPSGYMFNEPGNPAAGVVPLPGYEKSPAMTTTLPDGTVIQLGGGKPLTEAQSKDNVFTTRAEGALRALEPVADALASFSQRAVGADPTGVVRGAVQTDEFQVAQNAGNEFLQAILRKDTGAAITEQEQELYGKTYLPQPGDNAAVLVAKAAARARAIEAMKAGMSAQQIVQTEAAIIKAAERAAPVQIDGFTIEAVE